MAYTQLYYPPTTNGLQKTLGDALDAGENTMVISNTTGVQDKPGVVVVNRIDTNSAEKSAALREYISYTGVVGTTNGSLTGLTRGLGGTSDQDHAVGSVIEFICDLTVFQAVIDFLLVEHEEADGTHDSAVVAKLAGAQTFTGAKTFTTGLLKAVDITSGSGVNTLPTSSQTLVGRTTTDTLTNKRITPRVVTATDDATAVIDVDVTDQYQLTAVANATEFTVSGTPVNGQKLIIRLKDAGVAKALTWTGFTAVGVTLPTTTVANKTHYVGCIYNSAGTTWDAVAVVVTE